MTKILLVDDSPLDVELALAALAENNLAEDVIVCNDGEEALDYLFCRGNFAQREKNYPHVMFLDLKMPKIDGLEVLSIIKSSPELKTIPVVMLTSSKEEKDLVKSYHLGVNSYVVKPVDFQEFLEVLQKLGLFWVMINQPPPVNVNIAIYDQD
jgi:CheY-like chemotaxis protein